jgi:hypothetical protein
MRHCALIRQCPGRRSLPQSIGPSRKPFLRDPGRRTYRTGLVRRMTNAATAFAIETAAPRSGHSPNTTGRDVTWAGSAVVSALRVVADLAYLTPNAWWKPALPVPCAMTVPAPTSQVEGAVCWVHRPASSQHSAARNNRSCQARRKRRFRENVVEDVCRRSRGAVLPVLGAGRRGVRPSVREGAQEEAARLTSRRATPSALAGGSRTRRRGSAS